MNFSLIICTYMRSKSLNDLLGSIIEQTVFPDEILIIDGSPDNLTKEALQEKNFKNLQYYKVSPENRGLTKQRNFGIKLVDKTAEVVCFLDDDTILEKNYFEEILKTYQHFPDALGVGGYIINEVEWIKSTQTDSVSIKEFYFDGWKRNDSMRHIIRKLIFLESDVPPGHSPLFSHGRSVSFLPPSGDTYEIELLIGCSMSFRTTVFKQYQFSSYFEGYGLYEDADFSLRLSKIGKLYINTNAKLNHYHAPSGRPNKFEYGKMVVKNGWYVWRVKNPNPKIIDRLKWNCITLLLLLVLLVNVFVTRRRIENFTEFLGRTSAWIGLFFRIK